LAESLGRFQLIGIPANQISQLLNCYSPLDPTTSARSSRQHSKLANQALIKGTATSVALAGVRPNFLNRSVSAQAQRHDVHGAATGE
jgi:hypothetical protein